MLEIIVDENEIYNAQLSKFITIPSCSLILEHSLISLSKWESKWKIPYLSEKPRTARQELDYIRCMAIPPIKNDLVFEVLTPENIKEIRDYIENPMTATVIKEPKGSNGKKQVMTAEILYSRMFYNGIPMECQKWHLNRLITLIRVCEEKNAPPKKMSKQQTAQWNAQQNAARRAQYNTRG